MLQGKIPQGNSLWIHSLTMQVHHCYYHQSIVISPDPQKMKGGGAVISTLWENSPTYLIQSLCDPFYWNETLLCKTLNRDTAENTFGVNFYYFEIFPKSSSLMFQMSCEGSGSNLKCNSVILMISGPIGPIINTTFESRFRHIILFNTTKVK